MISRSDDSLSAPSDFAARGFPRTRDLRRLQFTILVTGFLLLVLLWAVPLAVLDQQERREIAAIETRMENLSGVLAQESGRNFLHLTLFLQFLVQDIERDPASFRLDQWVAKVAPPGNVAFQISTLGPDGLVTASTTPDDPIGSDLSESAYFQVHKNGQSGLYIGRSGDGGTSRLPVLPLSQGFTDKDGRFGGVAVISLDLRSIAGFLERVRFEYDANAVLIGEDGLIRGGASRGGLLGEPLDRELDWPSPLRESAVSGSRRVVTPADGIEKVYAYHRLQDLPLYVVASTSSANISATMAADRGTAIRLDMVVTGAILVLLFLQVRSQERRHRGEEALARQRQNLEWLNRDHAVAQARYRSVFDSLTEIVFQTDARGRWTLLNPAWETLTGCRIEQSLGGSFLRFVHPDDRAWVLAQCRKSLVLGPEIFLERVRCVGCSGTVRWLEVRARLLGGDGCGIQYIAGAMSDITDRTTAITALLESEGQLAEKSTLLRVTLDNIDQGIIMMDRWRRIIVSNRRMEELFDLPAGLLDNRPSQDVLLKWFWDAGEFSMRADPDASLAIASTFDIPPVVEHQRPNGQTIEIHSIRLLDGGMVRTYADITERRRAELALHGAKDAAEAGGRARSAFLATMSHEIRTPLNGVIGLGSLLTGTDLDTVQRRYVDGLMRSGEHLLQLINDILDFSKLDAARMQLSREPLHVALLVQSIVSMLNPRAVTKNVSLLHEIAGTVPPIVLGDPGRLRQVLLNIAGNAIKFTDHGHVRIAVDGAPLDTDTATITFSISDTGPGISSEDQRLLFREFEQLDGSLSRRHEGTGLGLAISRRLTELMGSRIELESRPGEGSSFRFTVTLPIGSEQPAVGEVHGPGTTIAELVSSRGRLKILLAEDNETNQFVAATMLQNQGCVVDVVRDGHETVAAAGREAYDLVLMDMMMPGMDGLAATRAIRTLPGCCATPIVALTANAFAGDQAACLEAGMTGFLTKPITLQKLDGAVVAALLGIDGFVAPEEPPAVTDDRSLDPNAIASLKTTYGAAVGRFLSLFVEDSTERLGRIDALAASGACETLVVEAHTLKGAALTFGCIEVGRLAADLESAARGGTPDLLPVAGQLSAAFARAQRDLERTFQQAA